MVNYGLNSQKPSQKDFLRQINKHSHCEHRVSRNSGNYEIRTANVTFRYCSPRSPIFSSSDSTPPLARELIEIDSEYDSSSAYQFKFDIKGDVWPDVVKNNIVRFNINIDVEIQAKGVRADNNKFTTVKSYNHSKLRKFRSIIAKRVLSAYVEEWERRGVEVKYDDSAF